MSEQEPRQPKRYYVEYNNEKYTLGPDNTLLYLHANQPEYDHIYIQFNDGEDGEQVGHYMWRQNTENFDDMTLNLIQVGCQQILKEDVSNFDYEQFMARFGIEPSNEPSDKENPVESPENAPELDWISPRQERQIKNAVGFLIYLAENGRL